MKINSDYFYLLTFCRRRIIDEALYRLVWYDDYMVNRKGYMFVVLVFISWYRVEENQ